MWERTLQGLVRGIRANKQDESGFISLAIEEIRQEIKSKDMELKAGAVLKLTYLDMLGYDMSWASFYIVEVMSSPKVHLKTVGYLAAAQSFTQDTDVLMLTNNLLKKDFTSRPDEVAISLNGFSQIVTPDLARDLSPDLIKMLSHSRPHIRKRAVVLLFKVFQKYPEVIPQAMGRLGERLEDPDLGVVVATVNTLCELARYNPVDYLSLAPVLFHLLTTSNHNWMLIKLVKLFGTLTPHEPRLVKKLMPRISEIITTTPAVSLLYECVRTCITGGMLQGTSGNALAKTCVSKLATFLQDEDQNLKYIALLAMVKIVPTHPHLVAEYQDMILSSIDDQDISIRMRALDLVSAMANSSNLQPIVQQLLSHLVRNEASSLPSALQSLQQHASSVPQPTRLTSPSHNPAYRLTLSQRILALGSHNLYENVADFEWYLSVLIDLAYVSSVNVGGEIRDQLVDVTARVKGVRRFAVSLMVKLLCDDNFLMNANQEGSCSEVLWAAAFICGEYCGELADPQKLLVYLLQPRVLDLASDTVAVYLQASIKVFGIWASELAERWDQSDLPKVKNTVESTIERFQDFVSNSDIEVQERAANMLQLFTFIRADLNSYRPPLERDFGYAEATSLGVSEPSFPKSLFLIQPLSSPYELNTVASAAQASVPVPDGLDLDAWIVPPPKEVPKNIHVMDDEGVVVGSAKVKKVKKGKGKDTGGSLKTKGKKKKQEVNTRGDRLIPVEDELTEVEKAEQARLKAERLERLKDDPFYLTDDRHTKRVDQHDVDSIPVVRLDDLPPLSQEIDRSAMLTYHGILNPPAVNSRIPVLRSSDAQFSRQAFTIDRVGEMPKGVVSGATPAISTMGAKTNNASAAIALSSSPGRLGAAQISRGSSPSSVGNGIVAPPIPLPSFPPYEVEDDSTLRTGTPPPIKVTRAKKKTKAAASNGKKRAAAGGGGTVGTSDSAVS